MLSEVAVRVGELLAVLTISGVVLLTVAGAGVWWLNRRLRSRLQRARRAVAGRARQAAAGGAHAGGRWLWSLPWPDRHWGGAVRDRRRLWRAVTAAEHAVAQARKVGAPTGDLDSLCRRLRQAATASDRSVSVAGRAAPAGRPDHASAQAAELAEAAGLIRDAAASAAASVSGPAVASLAHDTRQEVVALSAGLASAALNPGSRGLPGQPA